MTDVNFDILCRLCGLDGAKKIGIFDSDGEAKQLYRKIRDCLPVVILEDDELPQQVCEACMFKVETFNEFREFTLETESKLSRLLQQKRKSTEDRMHEEQRKEDCNDSLEKECKNEGPMPLEVICKEEQSEIAIENVYDMSDSLYIERFVSSEQPSAEVQENVPEQGRMNGSDGLREEVFNKEENKSSDQSDCPENDELSSSGSGLGNEQLSSSVLLSNYVSLESGTESSSTPATSTKYPVHASPSTEQMKEMLKANMESIIQLYNKPSGMMADQMAHEGYNYFDGGNKPKDEDEKVVDSLNRLAVNSTDFIGSGGQKLPEGIQGNGGPGLRKCETCGKFVHADYYRRHKNTHIVDRNYPCEVCSKRYKTAQALKQHAKRHNKELFKFGCKICGKTFLSQVLLRYHQRKHTDNPPFRCRFCNRGFFDKLTFGNHENIHTKDKVYICETCNAHYFSYGSYYSHLQKHKSNGHVCDICGKSFTMSQHLKRHVERHSQIGEGELFTCEQCGRSVKSRMSLVEHQRIHTGEKPYVCEICGKRSRTHTLHTQHSLTHTGERKFICDLCNKSFTQSKNLVIHKRSHTGDRPYGCSLCGKAFTSRSALLGHKKSHTNCVS